jgi:hypothetical protein
LPSVIGGPGSLDDFIGLHQQLVWNGEAECLGGLEVNH